MMEPTPSQLVDKVDTLPIPPKLGVVGVLQYVRKHLENPIVLKTLSKVVIDARSVTVYWRGTPQDQLDDVPVVTNVDALSKVVLVELQGLPEHTTASHGIGEAVLYLERQNMAATHCLVGEETFLWEWLGIDLRKARVRVPERIMGCAIIPTPNLPPETIVILGGENPIGLEDVTHGVKVNISLQETFV